MLFAIAFPAIAPEIFSIEIFGITIAPRWYALAYLVGIGIGAFLVWRALKVPRLWRENAPAMVTSEVESLVTYVVLGIIIGGRLGYVFFYQPAYYIANPLEIPLINRGGMAFHGGLIGVAVAGLLFAWRHKVNVASLADLLAL
ncbi:MAG: prolipoprotein diacylglyceryl transferase, partial [Pseudomonadota bacterium]